MKIVKTSAPTMSLPLPHKRLRKKTTKIVDNDSAGRQRRVGWISGDF